MKKIKIIADNKIPFLRGVLEPFAVVSYLDPFQITREIIKDAEALLVRTRTKCDSELLEGSTIKFIGTATIGFDHIDTELCEINGDLIISTLNYVRLMVLNGLMHRVVIHHQFSNMLYQLY